MKIEYLNRDELLCIITIDESSGIIEVKNLIEEQWKLPFPKNKTVTMKDLYDFLEDRVFEKPRPDRYLILDELELEHFEPLLIAKKTHGALWDDYNWLRFDGEELTFKDVQLRR